MGSTIPTVSDITALLAALEKYPIGAMLLLLFVLAGVLALWVYKQKPVQKPRTAMRRKLAVPEIGHE